MTIFKGRQKVIDSNSTQTAVITDPSTSVRELENELRSLRQTIVSANETRQKYGLLRQELEKRVEDERKRGDQIHASLVAERETTEKLLQLQALEHSKKSEKTFITNELAKVNHLGMPSSTVSGTYGLSPNAFYGGQHHKDIRIMERIAMKMGSERARESIALGATDQKHSLNEILVLARGSHRGLFNDEAVASIKNWNKRSLLSLARVMADQSLFASDRADAVAIYELVLRVFGPGSIDKRARYIFVETLQELQDFGRAAELQQLFKFSEADPVQLALLQCNIEMAVKDDKGGWLSLLNDLYESDGLATISIATESSETDLLDQLSVVAPDVEEGPLVSVMMPTHNGSAWIRTAINSVLGQTWRNLELIIVDDHSDDIHWKYLQRVAKSDSRISVFRLDSNQGAYRARNFAFEKTHGEFVTVHDDDDWSHPQKIETQVRHLLADDAEVGNMSYQTRIDQNNLFLRINDNPQFNQRNYSSMMVRRSLVVKLGGWDDINRGADAEFHDRVRMVTGRQISGIVTAPLSFMRARSGSLTAGEIQKGALDFARQTFGLLYGTWHKKIDAKVSSGEVLSPAELDPKKRSFRVPANMLSGNREVKYARFDVIFITDFRFPGGNSSLIAAEIAAAAESGLRVAVAQLDSPVLRANHSFNDMVHDALNRYSIPILTLTDKVETQLVVLRNPTILQFADRLKTNIISSKVVIVANSAPIGQNGSNFCYEISDCIKSAHGLFERMPEVYPESPQTRALLESISPLVSYAQEDWTGFLNPKEYANIRQVDSTRKPVVGRHSRDHALKWPDSEADIRSVYVQPDSYLTKILGGASSIEGIIRLEAEPSVEVFPFGSVTPISFLPKIDFWVYQHSSHLTESFGMSIIEAMASGAVVILPHYMESLFLEAAVYSKPSEVRGLVETYWNAPEIYEAQSIRAVNAVAERFSTMSFAKKIEHLARVSAEGRAPGIERKSTDGS